MKTILAYIGALALIAGLALVFAFPVMWGINYVFTPQVLLALFGISKLTFWKTLVLDWVTATLFKGVIYNKK